MRTKGKWTVRVGNDVKVYCEDGRSFNFGDAIYHKENIENAEFACLAVNSHSTLTEENNLLKAKLETAEKLALEGGVSEEILAFLKKAKQVGSVNSVNHDIESCSACREAKELHDEADAILKKVGG